MPPKKSLIRLNIDVAYLQQLIELPDKDELLLLATNGLYTLNTDDYSVKQVFDTRYLFSKTFNGGNRTRWAAVVRQLVIGPVPD